MAAQLNYVMPHAPDFAMWQVLCDTGAFWEELKRLHFIGLIASVCKQFSVDVPLLKIAWEASVSCGPSHLPKQFLREVFCLNRYEFRTLKPYPTTTNAMRLSFAKFRGPTGLCAARRLLLKRAYKTKTPTNTTESPS